MRSKKRVKDLEELTLPFTIIPSRDIYGGVNGKNFYFQRDELVELSYQEYQAIFCSDYKGEL